ncbi:hypothetical protein JXA63_03650 [Candidatus Woesebacteria bacterium]|nr:hypothetical protein [Candidatus Woesebacteria bacterium]
MPEEKDQPREESQDKQTGKLPKYEKEKVLFEWEAPERPFKERKREFWISLIAISIVFCLILYIVEGVMPVILIISILFLFYILSTVKPQKIKYAITNRGVKMAESFAEMDFLVRYWFGKRFGSDLLIFQTVNFPGRLELVVDSKDKKKISEVLEEYIPEEDVPPSNLEKAANWFSEKIPGNK